jgi:hypothetical protein
MKRQGWVLCLALALGCAKDDPPTTTPEPDAGTPDNSEELNKNSPYGRRLLDGASAERLPLSMAVGPGDRVGVAYFVSITDKDYELRYVEVSGERIAAPEKVATVQRVFGLSLAFDANGRPAVAYLGGGNEINSPYWFQSDAVVAYRGAAGGWTERQAAVSGDQAVAGNPVSDRGAVVGLHPALVFNSGNQAILVYRDVHGGQFEQQDWNGSDLEVAVGGQTTWTRRVVVAGGDDKQAWGGHTSMVMAANGQPAIVHDQIPGSGDGYGQNVFFQRRNADGSWTGVVKVQSVANTQLGASLAWHPQGGYGVAVVDRTRDLLTYTSSTDGSTWSQPDPVFQSGSGGWYPSLAIDPQSREPSIAFYVCSTSAGVDETGCNPFQDELRVTTRNGLSLEWNSALVDAEGGFSPKLAFLSTGQRVVAYRSASTGAIKLATEQ